MVDSDFGDWNGVYYLGLKMNRFKNIVRNSLISRYWWWIAAFLLGFVSAMVFYLFDCSGGKNPEWGLNFSQKYAAWLNKGDWKQVYLQILEDLRPPKMRLMAYWDVLEKKQDKFSFEDLDWQLKEAKYYKSEIVLAIGYRVPRWPECHIPSWAQKLTQEEQQEQILDMLKAVVERYKENSQIIGWQVENEPFFMQSFGMCPAVDKDFYKKEVAFVRSLDGRPIYGTESGELSTWRGTAGIVDFVGTSVYRTTWNKYFGYFTYPLPPAYYFLKTQAIKLFYPVKGVVVSEMQMEPWLPDTSVWDMPIAQQLKILNMYDIEENLNYARRTGLTPVYLWGAEWWFWLKQKGYPEAWNVVKDLRYE